MTMKHFLLPLLLLAALAAPAQEARTLFVEMPDSILPLLTPVNRADCVDFLDSHMRAVVSNRLGGKSEMTMLTPTYVRLQLTTASAWQMKVLTLSDTARVICTVATAYGPAPDSRIRFYDTRWRPLPTADFLDPLPGVADFLVPLPDSTRTYALRDARRQADLTLLDAALAPDSTTLTLTLATPRYMQKEAADELKPLIRRALIFDWTAGRFRPRRPL